MPGPEIPGTDHVSRLCGRSKCDDDGRPLGAAFMLRGTETYLSTNWLECTGPPTRADQLGVVRRHLAAKGMKLSANACLAVLHVQTLSNHVRLCSPDARAISAHHEPEPPFDPSHSGVYGYTSEDDSIADLIADVVEEVHRAKD
jgi:hypothetical protein